MKTTIIAGDSSEIWEVGFALSEEGVEPPVLANMADSYTCKLVVEGTAINRAVTAISPDGKAFQSWLTAAETINLTGTINVGIEIRNATLTPPLVRETQLRFKMKKGIVPPA